MATLRDQDKTLIVTRLACFYAPTEVQDELREVRNVEVTLSQVQYYDPTQPSSSKLGKRWRVLFEQTRADFRREVERTPIANKAYRLRELQKIIETTRSPKLKMEAMEQAAKEVGDVYTNRRNVALSGRIDWAALTDDQIDALADGKDPADVLGGVA